MEPALDGRLLYRPVACPFSRAAFQLAGHDKIAQQDGFFLAKKSGPLFEPVEWDRVRDNSWSAVGLDQLRGRSAGGLESGPGEEGKKRNPGVRFFFFQSSTRRDWKPVLDTDGT